MKPAANVRLLEPCMERIAMTDEYLKELLDAWERGGSGIMDVDQMGELIDALINLTDVVAARLAAVEAERDQLKAWKESALEAWAVRDKTEAKLDEVMARHPKYLGWNRYEAIAHLLEASLSEALPACPQWQPIETAPKDGTHIDLAAKSWLPAFDRFEYRRYPDCCWMNGDTMCNRAPYWLNLGADCCPTHWMPIPAPPVPPPTVKGPQS